MPKKASSPIDQIRSVNPANPNFNLGFTTNVAVFLIALIIIVLVLVLHYAMYTWTEELEKTGCECSDLWYRNFIHWIALVLMIIIPINIVIQIYKIKSQLLIPYTFILFVLQISYVAMIFEYITKLKKLECECSESWKREYGYIGSIVYICYFGLILLLLILGLVMVGFMHK
jgi:magnesium-transporting ATPase (P-type)